MYICTYHARAYTHMRIHAYTYNKTMKYQYRYISIFIEYRENMTLTAGEKTDNSLRGFFYLFFRIFLTEYRCYVPRSCHELLL